jgi:signal transduction histidine kinase
MRRYFEIIYWLVAVGLISLVFVSLTKSYGSALFLAIMMLPGALFAKFFGSSISFKNRKRGIFETIYFLSIILLIVYLAIFLACFYLYGNQLPERANILFNPIFIWFLLIGFWKLEGLLATKLSIDKMRDKFIEFTSERKKIKIEIDTIQYIESCDDFVLVVVLDGKEYRTKMNITLWSNILDDRFERVHRAFIVNKKYVKSMSAGRLELVSGAKIEVSKRYRDRVEEWFGSVD